jgi:hypothetical protein
MTVGLGTVCIGYFRVSIHELSLAKILHPSALYSQASEYQFSCSYGALREFASGNSPEMPDLAYPNFFQRRDTCQFLL